MGMLNAKSFKGHKMGDRVKPVLVTGPGLTKQEFGKESDINVIMKRYAGSGVLPGRLDGLQPVFADVSGIGDYADTLRRVDAAREAFGQLPAEIRTRFGNRAEALVDFLQHEENRDEAVKLGLVSVKPAVPAAPVVPAVPVVK